MNLVSVLALLGINFLLINCYFYLAIRWKIIDIPNERSSHKDITIRGGGILFPIAWFLYSFWNGLPEPYVDLAVLLVALVSFLDDFISQKPLVRVLFHMSAILLICFQYNLIQSLEFISLILVIILSIGILNAVNFMDGINGISVLYFGVFLVSTWLSSQKMLGDELTWWSLENPFVYLFSSLVVFAFYNLRLKAKTFAGDVGSVTIGIFIVIMLLMFGNSGLEYSTSIYQVFNYQNIFFLAVYGIDVILTIVRRLLKRENILKPHRCHLYQILVNELGMSHLSVAGIYAGIQLIFNIYLIYWSQGFLIPLLICVLLGVVYLLVKKKIG